MSLPSQNEIYINQCIQLAANGLGNVAPNPMVGCIIVKDNRVIAKGFHEQFGQAHAEPNAMMQLSDEELNGAVLYVNLEPCSHYGKTPPCADLIISKNIKKVVIGNLDSNPLVAGKGVEKLRAAGIEVEYGILEQACRELNKRFFTYHEKKRPYVILKWAQTQDNFISRWPLPEDKTDNWITGEQSKYLVHQWRSEEQAILIGHNTLIADNPLLTNRLSKGKNPTRMLLSRYADVDARLNIFNEDAKTIVFNTQKDEIQHHVHFVKIDWNRKIDCVMDYCYQHQISSVIVEGGTNTIYHFMNTNVWDEARVFINSKKQFVNGLPAPEINFSSSFQKLKVGDDDLYYFKNM